MSSNDDSVVESSRQLAREAGRGHRAEGKFHKAKRSVEEQKEDQLFESVSFE